MAFGAFRVRGLNRYTGVMGSGRVLFAPLL